MITFSRGKSFLRMNAHLRSVSFVPRRKRELVFPVALLLLHLGGVPLLRVALLGVALGGYPVGDGWGRTVRCQDLRNCRSGVESETFSASIRAGNVEF